MFVTSALACAPAVDAAPVADALTEMSEGDATGHEAHWRAMLASYAAKTGSRCFPPVDRVLGPPPGPMPPRRIDAIMPHYSLFDGPVRYRVGASEGRWRVALHVAVEAEAGGTLELPDCAIADALEGEVICEGTPYEQAPGVEACPEAGRFEAPATRHNLRALLARWSKDAERYYNRDAARYGLPVRYDFEMFLASGPPRDRVAPVDLSTELDTTCARTPYFASLRSGWSIPILAHEIGHYLGLIDEYEALSGIVPTYPKTPFEGSEDSRMGLSMKTHTRLLPIHHYLVLRRLHCAAGERPFDELLLSR